MLKPFLQWLAVTLSSFGVFAAGYHLYLTNHPARILVVLDTSFPMRTSWPGAEKLLDTIGDRRYAEFSLYTEKGPLHGWQRELRPGKTLFYAPRDWSRLEQMRSNKEFAEATDIILVTNAAGNELKEFSGWTVMRVN